MGDVTGEVFIGDHVLLTVGFAAAPATIGLALYVRRAARSGPKVISMVQAARGKSLPRSALDSSRLPYRSRSACQAASFSGRIHWP
jgi:hypothetical protein